MNVSGTTVILRVPELGPSLGKLVTGTGRVPGGVDLDDLRMQLTSRIIEAAGEARRLIDANEAGAALESVGRGVWQAAWEEAAASVANRVVTRIDAHLTAEARAVRMPRRRLRRFGFGEDERGLLAKRLGTRGAPLVSALDALEIGAVKLMAPAGGGRIAEHDWQDALKLASRRLEAAWLAMEDAVEHEVSHWRNVGNEIARWRRAHWPVVLIGVSLTAAAAWLGLVLGGYIESPPWFTSLWQTVFE